MIVVPDGWRRVAAVGAEMFASPDRTIQVRYQMRVSPLRRFASLVEDALRELPEWRTAQVGARERIITHEGEYAFGVGVTGTWLGAEARRYVGVIYADDFMNVLDTIAIGAEPLEPLESRGRVLLHGASLHLGKRARRYFYDRPGGWHGHATGLVTHWFPAAFPARPAAIVVYPANPTNEQPHAVFDAILAHQQATGADLRDLANPVPIAGRDALEGLHWTLTCTLPTGRVIARDLVVYARGAFTYALQLDACHRVDEEARAVFLAVARSVEPLAPGGVLGANEPGTFAVFSHYV